MAPPPGNRRTGRHAAGNRSMSRPVPADRRTSRSRVRGAGRRGRRRRGQSLWRLHDGRAPEDDGVLRRLSLAIVRHPNGVPLGDADSTTTTTTTAATTTATATSGTACGGAQFDAPRTALPEIDRDPQRDSGEEDRQCHGCDARVAPGG